MPARWRFFLIRAGCRIRYHGHAVRATPSLHNPTRFLVRNSFSPLLLVSTCRRTSPRRRGGADGGGAVRGTRGACAPQDGREDPEKKRLAEALIAVRPFVMSMQVVQEFHVRATQAAAVKHGRGSRRSWLAELAKGGLGDQLAAAAAHGRGASHVLGGTKAKRRTSVFLCPDSLARIPFPKFLCLGPPASSSRRPLARPAATTPPCGAPHPEPPGRKPDGAAELGRRKSGHRAREWGQGNLAV